jgi:hypothetical protein
MEKAKNLLGGPIVVRNGSMADNKEVSGNLLMPACKIF